MYKINCFFFQFFFAFCLLILSFLILDVGYSLINFSLLCLVLSIPVSKKESIANPKFIFGIFFYLYNTFYFYFIILRGDYDPYLIVRSISYSSVAIFFYVSSVNLTSLFLKEKSIDELHLSPSFNNPLSQRIIYFLLFIVTICFCIYSYKIGGSKRELQASVGYFATIAQILTLYLVILGLIRFTYCLSTLNNLIITLIPTFFILFFYYIITGERGDLFRFGICIFLIFYDFKKKVPFVKLCFLVFLGVLVLPITQAFKSVLLTGGDGLIYTFNGIFFGEFSSASRNLYLIVKHGQLDNGLFLIVGDIFRAMIPFSSNLGFSSSVSWYHFIYRPHFGFGGDVGWGLGLVPQAVLIGGYIGTSIIFSILGLVSYLFYIKRTNGILYYVFYFVFITTLIYCLRADIANLLSISFKIVFALYLCLFLAKFFLKRRISDRT